MKTGVRSHHIVVDPDNSILHPEEDPKCTMSHLVAVVLTSGAEECLLKRWATEKTKRNSSQEVNSNPITPEVHLEMAR